MAAAALTLSLGIGANTAVFSLIKALILQPLPGVEHPEKLVVVGSRTHNGQAIPLSYPNYKDIRDLNTVFSTLAASATAPVSFSAGGPARRQWAELVSSNYFATLGVRVVLGRPIVAGDNDQREASPVAVLSHTFWRNEFHSDPNVLGGKILLNGHPFEVVGVAPEGFQGAIVGLSSDLFVPLTMQAQADPMGADASVIDQRDTQWLVAQGRLKPGVSSGSAQSAMSVLGRQLLASYPNDQIAERAVLFPLWRSPFGTQSYLLPAVSTLGVVGLLVLLVACGNVATVLLAAAGRRGGEIAIRMALGANRARVIRQLLIGSLLLTLVAGGLGLLGAVEASRLFRLPPGQTDYPISLNSGVDSSVFVFSLALTVMVGIAIGLVPAFRVSRTNMVSTLRSEGDGRIQGRTWAVKAILAGQIALSLVLLLGAGMLIKGVLRFSQANPGFDRQGVLLAALDLGASGRAKTAQPGFITQLLKELDSTPGVATASVAARPPLSGPAVPSTEIAVEGYQPRKDENMVFYFNVVGPAYLQSLAIPLVEGRDFTFADDANVQQAVIVNATLARRFWPGQSAVGRKMAAAGVWRQVIGVAADSKYLSIAEEPQPFVFLPYLQNPEPQVTVQARGNGDPLTLAGPVRDAVRRLDPGLAVLNVKSLDQQVQASMFGFRAVAGLLGTAGILALALAAVGVYGIAAQSVVQRLHEIGIRTALGASPRDVVLMILSGGFRLTLGGAAFGLLLSLGVSRVLQRMFRGVDGLNMFQFAGVVVLLALVVLAASWFPANRAARLHPGAVLRER